VTTQRVLNKIQIDALKREPCTDCGNTFPSDAMDFDHVRGVKIANISDLISGPPEALIAELSKVELVCATCHRIREMNRRLDRHVDAAELFDVELDAL
jgi:hypothetical protein